MAQMGACIRNLLTLVGLTCYLVVPFCDLRGGNATICLHLRLLKPSANARSFYGGRVRVLYISSSRAELGVVGGKLGLRIDTWFRY